MRIYCVRDRLIDYFMTPFAAPEDKAVLQSLSNAINNPGATDAIAQAPHQFEIWKLGHVTENGHLVPEREYLGDCSSLVRARVRNPGTSGERQAAPTAGPTAERRTGAPEGLGGHA